MSNSYTANRLGQPAPASAPIAASDKSETEHIYDVLADLVQVFGENLVAMDTHLNHLLGQVPSDPTTNAKEPDSTNAFGKISSALRTLRMQSVWCEQLKSRLIRI